MDPKFLDAVQTLYSPEQGTERMAELLYLLIRFTRPSSVLEAGMGFTSAFIAKGLHDNQVAWARERERLVAKTRRYAEDLAVLPRDAQEVPAAALGLSAAYAPKSTRLAERRAEWMFQEPVLARPAHYIAPHRPRAYCIDNLSDPHSTAARVSTKLAELGLAEYVQIQRGNFWTFDLKALPIGAAPVDMMWIDVWLSVENALSLIEGPHWRALNPAGGLLLIHCMLSTEGGAAIIKEFQHIQRRRSPHEFELLGLLEPHKVLQNNVLLIRKVAMPEAEYVEQLLNSPVESTLEQEAHELLERHS